MEDDAYDDEQDYEYESDGEDDPVKAAASGADATSGNSEEEVRIIDEAELRRLMSEVVGDLVDLMKVREEAATALLRHFSWNKEKLLEKFYADPESVMTKVGVSEAGQGGSSGSHAEQQLHVGQLNCAICTEENVPGSRAFALPCGHYFCDECWTGYLEAKVSDGPTCIYTTCPAHKCPLIVPENFFHKLASAPAAEKYDRYALNSFVDINKKLRFCPGKGCARVVQAPPAFPCVKCSCGMAFCFGCGEEAHNPADCSMIVKWKEKCQNESETANWILANTKRCPKCNTRIEKNQGCNHMTCMQCKFEFCWTCMGPWAEHGNNTGGFYKCNRYNAGKPSKDESDAARAKAELDRYLHYYQRYHGHAQAQAFAEKQQDATEKRMVELQESSAGSTWIDVQFLKTAQEQLIECRRVLKYTYVFGYYLGDGTQHKNLFEQHQCDLEQFTEKLSELSEMPLDQMKLKREDVINYTRVTGQFLRALLDAVTAEEMMVTASEAVKEEASPARIVKGEETAA